MIARRVRRGPEVRDGGYTAAGTIDIEALLQRCTPGRLSCLANRGVATVPRLGSLLVHRWTHRNMAYEYACSYGSLSAKCREQ